MKGHLHLTCSLGANGESYLREQSFRAPLHLSKPHHDGGALVVNIVNPTAGIFDDDEIDLNITVESQASLVLTTPSSGRVYRSRNGLDARVNQELKVAAGSFLEFYPEPFIPHAGARYHQRNTLRVAETGSMIFIEWLSPGRVASGESFLYDELCWDTDVILADKVIARERYTLNPKDESLNSLNAVFENAHYLGCFVIGTFSFPQDEIEALGSDDVYIGAGPLVAGGWTIKAICRDSLHARKTLSSLRTILYQAMKKDAPTLGRF
jgi:urease accessory protein